MLTESYLIEGNYSLFEIIDFLKPFAAFDNALAPELFTEDRDPMNLTVLIFRLNTELMQ
jgi:hypothetical protein